MRHHNANRKLNRDRKQRTALLRSLGRSLVIHEKITTTEAKAKEVRAYIEKLVTKGKINSVASRRILSAEFGRSTAVKKIIETLAPKYSTRSGGYTRIIKLAPRARDAARMAIIEFV